MSSSQKSINSLGINFSNNGSICLLKNGEIDLYLEAERITRKKYDYEVKSLFKYIDKVDHIGFADCHWSNPTKNLKTARDKSAIKRLFPNATIHDYTYDHHLTHAYGAWRRSGFKKDVAVIVVDSNGSKTTEGLETVSIFCNRWGWTKKHYEEYQTKNDLGIGRKFELAALEIGFNEIDAGKVMGLSAFGKGISYEVQKEWEKKASILFTIAEKYSWNIILTGGCFQNCVVNYKLFKEKGEHINMYVDPIAHDGGTAIGAAYLAYDETQIKNS